VATRLALQEAKANAQLTAIGRLKSALATFQDAIEGLADIERFQQRKVTVSDAERIGATASADAQPASHEIEVISLATAHRLVSTGYPGADAVIGEGQLVIASGADSMQIGITAANHTLAGIRDAINASANNPGVRASIVTGADGAHLILAATGTGAARAISVDAVAPGSALEALEFGTGTTNALTEATAAADAALEIDGFAVTSGSHEVEGAIEGATLALLQAGPGTLLDLDVSYDEDAAKSAAAGFVEAYNKVVGTIAELTAWNADAGTGGALLGDAATRGIKNSLRSALGRAVGDTTDPFRTLAEIGIRTGDDGKLSLDATAFGDALTADFDGVGRLFADEDAGIAMRLRSIVENFLDTDGRISTRETTLKARLDQIGDRREDLEARMEQVRKRYQAQFNALDMLVGQLNQTSSFLTRQLANL